MSGKLYRTRGPLDVVHKWREATGTQWDNAGEHRREIIYLGKGKGIVFVVKVD